MAITVAVAISVPVGIVSAVQRGKALGQALTVGAMLAASLPSFWIGLMLIHYFAVNLGWFPVAGYGPPDSSLAARLRYLVLPSLALGYSELGADHALHPHEHARGAGRGLQSERRGPRGRWPSGSC